VSFATDLFSIQ